MINVENMSFEEFIAFGEKETGQKTDDQVKAILSILFDNLKSGVWDENDLRNITDAMESDMNMCRKASTVNG